MAAWAISEYEFPGNGLMAIYLALGIMIPIRLGTIGILRLADFLDLVNTRAVLVLVYNAQVLPLAVFLLTAFLRPNPGELQYAPLSLGVRDSPDGPHVV